MFNRIHQKLGTAGFIISIVALVAALGGGAYAASAKLNSTQKKEVTKIAQTEAKKFAGKQGPTGATGPAGPTGPAGAAGTKGDAGGKGEKGDTGAKGEKGDNGTPGTNGKNVEIGTPTSGECSAGGATVQVAGEATTKKAVCNGTSGFTTTLPSESTETGSWATFTSEEEIGYAPISFSIPLAVEMDEAHVVYIAEGGEGQLGKCSNKAETVKGTASHPLAYPGYLCIYAGFEDEATFNPAAPVLKPGSSGNAQGAGTTGAILPILGEPSHEAFGTWAVTAP